MFFEFFHYSQLLQRMFTVQRNSADEFFSLFCACTGTYNCAVVLKSPSSDKDCTVSGDASKSVGEI